MTRLEFEIYQAILADARGGQTSNFARVCKKYDLAQDYTDARRRLLRLERHGWLSLQQRGPGRIIIITITVNQPPLLALKGER